MKSPKPLRPILATLLLFSVVADPVIRVAASDDNSAPQPVDFLGVDGNFEVEPLDRMVAERQLYGDYFTEEFKQNALAEIQHKQQLYADQLQGRKPRHRMPGWQSIGPTSDRYITNGVTLNHVIDSGRVASIVPHPTDGNTVYLLAAGGGLWKTTNFFSANTVWQPKTDSFYSTSGGAMALGRDPNTIYLGLGDPFGSGLVAGAMIKSTDGGDTWGSSKSLFGSLSGSVFSATDVRDVQVDRSGPTDIVLVATNHGLFRSTDGGESYAPVAIAGRPYYLYNYNYYLPMSVWSLARTSAGWLASVMDGDLFGSGALYLSTDHGASWQPAAGTPFASRDTGRITLCAAVPGDAIVYAYAGIAEGWDQDDLYVSPDGGLNWTSLNITHRQPMNPNQDQWDMDLMGGQAYYNQLIAVDPFDPTRRTIYLGGNLSTAKSTDGGASWRLTSNWLPREGSNYLPYVHADMHAAAWTTSPYDGHSILLFGSDGGIFVSENGGFSFHDKNAGLVTHQCQTVVSAGLNRDTALTGMQDDGVRQRLNATGNWDQVIGGDGEGVAWSQANNKVALGSIYYSLLYRHDNLSGDPALGNWVPATNGIYGSDYYPFYTPLATPTAAADPTGLEFFTATGSKVYRTADGARSWQQIFPAGGFDPYAQPELVFVMSHNVIGVHPRDGRRIAVAGTAGRLFLTNNGGTSWTSVDLTKKVAGYSGSNISAAWGPNRTLYAASAGTDPRARVRVVWSHDGGVNWQAADTGLPRVPIDQVLADPRDEDGRTAYAATWLGVYFTTDAGTSWRLLGSGLPNVWVKGLQISRSGLLRAATYGRGMWQIALSGDDWDEHRSQGHEEHDKHDEHDGHDD